MKENGNDLDRLLKEQLGDRQAGVPEFVWEKIEERIYPEKKRRGLFWWWLFGAGLLVVAGVWGVIGMESARELPTGRQGSKARYSVTENREGENVEKDGGETDFSTDPASSEASRDISGSRKEINEGLSGRNGTDLKEYSTNQTQSTKQFVTRDISEATNRKSGSNKHPKRVVLLGSQTAKTSSTNDLGTRDISGSPKGKMDGEKGSERSTAPGKEVHPELSQNPRAKEILPRNSANLPKQKVVTNRFRELWLSVTQSHPETHAIATLPPKTPLHGNTDTLSPLPKPKQTLSRFAILAYGGPSFYDMATLRPYFQTGQLSHRTFDASGFEAGLGTSFRISDRFSVYALGSFNRKQASHQYTLAITEEAYFSHVLQGEQLPLENIDDNANNNCFLAKDATATYTVSTWSAALGINFTVLQLGKWSVDTDLRFSVNVSSGMNVKETTVITLSDPEKERFSWYQPGAGLALRYQLNQRLSIGIAPLYSHRFHRDENSFSKKLNELIVPVTLRIGL